MFSPYSVADIKAHCEKYRIRPSKDRGQNFLIDRGVAGAMADALAAEVNTCVEIGPGLGALTFLLAEKVKQVLAIEIEPKLVRHMRQELAARGVNNVEVVEGDARDTSIYRNVELSKCCVASSLPYSITSDFFSLIFNDGVVPRRMVLLLQREVAERLAARPPSMTFLSVVAQWFTEVALVKKIPRSAFWPQPEVESAVVCLDACPPSVRRRNIVSENFLSFVRRAYKSPRKKIGNTLDISKYRNIEISEKRPGEISVDDWVMLYRELKKLDS